MRRKPNRFVIVAIVGAQVGIAALTWRDIRHRPAEQIRGSKRLWRVVSTINPGNSVAYWLVGRRYGQSRLEQATGAGHPEDHSQTNDHASALD
jgi:hypothetical protein